jgi:hypothetical protein
MGETVVRGIREVWWWRWMLPEATERPASEGGERGSRDGTRDKPPPNVDDLILAVELAGAIDWSVSAWDAITGALAAIAVGASELGPLSPTLIIGAGTTAEITAATGGLLGAGLAGWGIGTALDRYMTGVMGQSLGSLAYDVYEKAYEAWSGDGNESED